MRFIIYIVHVCAFAACAGHAASAARRRQAGAQRYNILHIIVDDLRAELGAYGLPDRHTPNIDALAASPGATTFLRAYAQQAVCGPSRNSFLSGRRPPTTQTYTFANSFRDVGPDWTSMLGFFKSKGYSVAGVGKIYHPHSPPLDDGAKSWSEAFLPYPEWSQGGDPCYATHHPIEIARLPPWGVPRRT